MRIEAILWTGVTLYFAAIGLIYLSVGGDATGVALLLIATGLGGLIAGWTWHWTRRHDERVEDRADVDAIDHTGVVGVYPTASLRPVALAAGTAALLTGVAIGSWLSMIGLAVVMSQLLLLTHDSDT
ncbi:cytochrome c oxidase subunit 4 [Ilumatobacter sp.]|uniref:aa3-type cytochrome oxidase subunit IV n=1 Tax=Ilumatobacter sp. TaxID=1967498 RepID=UPI003C38F369